jgi:hypothetical protein
MVVVVVMALATMEGVVAVGAQDRGMVMATMTGSFSYMHSIQKEEPHACCFISQNLVSFLCNDILCHFV